ncbi:hypothetical protein BDU57DRAFT_515748 [Ampelomyces quisqualis]|uniref:F-box domain-containing protein n=1 Tax=Ampelomyces quisqualis TaxID=50730 RepID=A0A6A5QKH4_AMPQU|nr:hypothetical protein BDU57DRAFT_515748 [Ampelomyces quisqualis]
MLKLATSPIWHLQTYIANLLCAKESNSTPVLPPKKSNSTPFLPPKKSNSTLLLPPKKSNSTPLLQLPGELRNKIYRLVLTAPTPLRLECSSFGPPILACDPNRSVPSEFNQLKNVNKCLYNEVAGLELKFNKIVVNAPVGEHPVGAFLSWRSKLSTASKGWIGGVTLMYESPEHSELIEPDWLRLLVPYFAGFPIGGPFCPEKVTVRLRNKQIKSNMGTHI